MPEQTAYSDDNTPTGESRRALEGRALALMEGLRRGYADADCALHHRNPFELLVATILSAQCTDARVNKVTPGLFARHPGASELARADRSELEELIRSTGFYRNKAKSIQGAATRIAEEFSGEVPQSMDELLSLPGVARKTANVVLGTAFGIADGIVVDTHVFRLSHRMGLAQARSPEQVERQLMSLVPREQWVAFGHRMIHHGRDVCSARAPDCDACTLEPHCPRLGVVAAKPRRPEKRKPPLGERIAAAKKWRKKK